MEFVVPMPEQKATITMHFYGPFAVVFGVKVSCILIDFFQNNGLFQNFILSIM